MEKKNSEHAEENEQSRKEVTETRKQTVKVH